MWFGTDVSLVDIDQDELAGFQADAGSCASSCEHAVLVLDRSGVLSKAQLDLVSVTALNMLLKEHQRSLFKPVIIEESVKIDPPPEKRSSP
jgi:hypothetical protein